MAKAKTHEQFIKEVFELVGNEYVVLSNYINFSTKLKIRHEKCGNVYETTPNNFLSGKRCRKCQCESYSKRLMKTNDAFVSEVYELVKDDYVFLDEYQGAKVKLTVIHNECGHEYKVTPSDFLSGCRCPSCKFKKLRKIRKKTTEKFKEELRNVTDGKFEVLSEYSVWDGNMVFIHTECENQFEHSAYYFLRNPVCPFCKTKRDYHLSSGEKAVNQFLNINNIINIKNYTFEDCKNIRSLPFDFAVFNDSKLVMIIEYDGQQHFESIDYFGGEEKFKERLFNDSIKNTYCIENNIPLLRIPYWEYDNIEAILHSELSKYHLMK